jgi:site-specific DNA-methyltransferase (adenine-specific)
MKKVRIGNATLYLGKMEDTIRQIRGVNHVLTDPPYLYIKTHDFDKEFDEKIFFEGVKDMLPVNGFIALFGRGTSFYRWNTRLADLGFVFKEEIVWDKIYGVPTIALLRIHELVAIHAKKNGKIKKCVIPYLEKKKHNVDGIINDINRIKSAVNSRSELNELIDFFKSGRIEYASKKKNIESVTIRNNLSCKRATATAKSIKDGAREASIIRVPPVHINSVHPTEKPIRLAERILALISDPGDTIYDPFMGSGSFGVACINTGRKYIGSEMKPEYFNIACKRITDAVNAAGSLLNYQEVV